MADFESFINDIRSNATEHAEFSGEPLSPSQLKMLAEALAANTSLEKLYLDQCELGNEAASILAGALSHNRTLSLLSVEGNQLDDNAVGSLIHALGPNITILRIRDNPVSDALPDMVETILKATGNKTLIHLNANRKPVWCSNNSYLATDFREKIKDPASITLDDWQEGLERLPAMDAKVRETFLAHLESLPTIKITPRLKRDDLFIRRRKDKSGPLDNPLTWAQFDEITAQLEAGGNPLQPSDLQTESQFWPGKTFLECGLICAPEQVIPFLNRHGIQLQAETFLGDDGNPTALLEDFTERHKIRSIFTPENWQGPGGLNKMKDFHARLPTEAREQVNHLHALCTALRTSPGQALAR